MCIWLKGLRVIQRGNGDLNGAILPVIGGEKQQAGTAVDAELADRSILCFVALKCGSAL